MADLANDYLICRSTDTDDYSIWRIDIDGVQLGRAPLLQRVPGCAGAKFDSKHQLIPIGSYILEWGPAEHLQAGAGEGDGNGFPYRLFKFSGSSADPLGAPAVTEGFWEKKKFWGQRPDFGNPEGAAKAYDKGEKLLLVPLGSFVLWVLPTTGRGTFKLFNFDPGSADPLRHPADWIYGSFDTIEFGHELLPLGNYVLDRLPTTGEYWLWSFDPMAETPLARPTVQAGRWDDIDAAHKLIPIGEDVLDWDVWRGTYRLWRFDPKSCNPLTEPVCSGSMPEGFRATMNLTVVQGLRPIDPAHKEEPGTIDFMRTKIKHVVYYMIENCSFDHVCGWLYDKGQPAISFVGGSEPFEGARYDMFNIDPDAKNGSKEVHLKKYDGDKLDFLPSDPYHDYTDVMRQYFFANRNGYAERAKPDMGGFVWNNGVPQVMWTFTPDQLPVLNGLAEHFAVSDRWFCSMPSATDPNRAFSLTGSALGQLNNFQNGAEYENWPDTPRRASIWKVLWANGFADWKIYNSIPWKHFVLSYHLFLKGQIPTVDANSADYIGNIKQFKDDAAKGTLPAFSFIEPVWIAKVGTTSYHPGADKAPGEIALNEVYEALKNSPNWNETLLIITFDEHGGVFDHVPPPYAENPWPNDVNDGFRYDIMGVRVPTILVSPWINERTVFRSSTPVAYDSTSILATLLHWYGIPKARWGLGERTHHAPTFEGVFQRKMPRSDTPSFTPPPEYRETLEGLSEAPEALRPEKLSDLDRLMVPRVVGSIAGGRLNAHEISEASEKILAKATNVKELSELIDDLAEQMQPNRSR